MKRIPYMQFISDPLVKYLPKGDVFNTVPVRIVGDKLEIYKVVVEINGIYFELVKEVEL